MMRTTILALIASLLVPIAAAEACGRRLGCRKKQYGPSAARPLTYTPAPAAAPYPTMYVANPAPSSPTAPTMTARPPQVDPRGVRPTYSYESGPEGAPAYYYAYNDSGELIVKQWMDWLFRGGRAAGMPAPPPPIIGRMLRP